MKKIITLIFCSVAKLIVAQDNNYDISLGAYIPSQIEGIPASAKAFYTTLQEIFNIVDSF